MHDTLKALALCALLIAGIGCGNATDTNTTANQTISTANTTTTDTVNSTIKNTNPTMNTSTTSKNVFASLQIPVSDTADFTTTQSGLQYKDLTAVGDGVVAKAGDAVEVHYTGMLPDGTKFDSSVDRGQPFAFSLGAGEVIKGWDEGIAGMTVGQERILVIPPELGYGSRGAGSVIPANATLQFQVKLMAINE